MVIKMNDRITLSDNVLKQLENLIVKELKPGEKLPTEAQLSETFSVSRSTIRESMKVLSAKGLVVRKNQGTFVSEKVNKCLIDPLDLLINMKIGNVRDLLELREMLELQTIRVAAERISEDLLGYLDHINWQMCEPGLSAQALQTLDIEFHNTIAKATGNAVLTEFLNAIRQVIVRNLEDCEAATPILEESMIMHKQLVAAMRAHDSAKAYEVMEHYFTVTRQ